MAQDTFQTFDLDLQRLLVAGSGSASGDDGLFRAKDAFDKLAARVPALAAASAQVSKVLDARGRAAAGELLSLGVINLKLRAAQAKPAAVEGALAPLPPAAPLDTTTPQHDLESLHRALTSGVTLAGRKIKRLAVINDAIERGVFLDLRLLPLWVQAMGDSTIGDRVADEIIPKLGEAAAPYLEQQFNPQGKAADARRLQGLVAIRGEAALPLVERCLQPPPRPEPASGDEAAAAPAAGKKGAKAAPKAAPKKAPREVSVEVRAAAVRALEKAAPAQAEARARALFETEGNQEVRAACIEVLGAGASAESLAVLLKALDDTDDVARAAVSALKRFGHPQTTERVLALLTPELRALAPYKAPRAKPGQKLTKAEQAAQQKAEQKAQRLISDRTEQLQRVIEVLGARTSTVVVDTLIDLYRNHALEEVRNDAGEALEATGDKRALGVLAERLQEKDGSINDLGIRAFFHLDLDTVFERMQPHLTAEAIKTKHGLSLAASLLEGVSGDGYILDDHGRDDDDESSEADEVEGEEGAVEVGSLLDEDRDEARETARRLARYPFRRDPRWGDVALRLLGHKTLAHDAMLVLGHLKDRRATEPLLELLRKGDDDDALDRALAAIGDPAAVPAVIEMLRGKKVSTSAYSFLGRVRSPQAVDALTAKLLDDSGDAYTIVTALERIGDPRAAAPIAQALSNKSLLDSPYYALRALRQLDSVEALPGLKAAHVKASKRKNHWYVSQFEDLITYLERAR